VKRLRRHPTRFAQRLEEFKGRKEYGCEYHEILGRIREGEGGGGEGG
jgi:hypothetical protein